MKNIDVQHLKLRRYLWRLVEVAALLLLITLVMMAFASTLQYTLPFVLGWLLALMLLPLVRLLERHHMRRPAAVLSVMVAVVGFLSLVSTYAVIALARETTVLGQNVTNYFDVLQNWVQNQVILTQELFGDLPPKIAAGMESTAMQALAAAEVSFRGFAKSGVTMLTHLPESIFVVVIAVIAAFFMLNHRERMYQSFLRALPPGWSLKIQIAIDDMMRALVGTIRVQVVLMLLSAALGVLGMFILHVQYAVILGIVFGLTGLIPILGSALLTVPWAIGALLVGDVSLALKLLLLQSVISLIRHLVEPKILADNVGLDMLSTLFGLYVGMKLAGVVGLFIGPIVLIGVKSLLRARMFVDFLPEDLAALPGDARPANIANIQKSEKPEQSSD